MSNEPTMTVGKTGDKFWCLNGKFHRLDGPAMEYSNGDKMWYQNGQPHRLDGPAVEWCDGQRDWYQNGKLHRLGGPAVEYANPDARGTPNGWFMNGTKVVDADSINDMFYLDDRGYGFFNINDHIRAGCREFTIPNAIKHWGSDDYTNTTRGREIVKLIKSL